MVSSQRDLALSCGRDQPSAGYCPEPGGSHNSLVPIGMVLCWNIAEQYNTTIRPRRAVPSPAVSDTACRYTGAVRV